MPKSTHLAHTSNSKREMYCKNSSWQGSKNCQGATNRKHVNYISSFLSSIHLDSQVFWDFWLATKLENVEPQQVVSIWPSEKWLFYSILRLLNEVSMPNLVPHLKHTPRFEWCKVRHGSKNGHHKRQLFNKDNWTMCLIILGSIVIIGEIYYI